LVLLFVMLLLGITEGGFDVGTNTLIVWVHRGGSGPFMNGLHFFFGLGAFLSPALVAYASAGAGIRAAYWAIALVMLPCALWLVCLPSPAAQHAAETERRPGSLTVLAIIVLFFFLYAGAELGF